MREPKYIPGEPFRNLGHLISWLTLMGDHGWCYWQQTPKHPNVIKNMTLSTLENAVRGRVIRPALDRHFDAAPVPVDNPVFSEVS